MRCTIEWQPESVAYQVEVIISRGTALAVAWSWVPGLRGRLGGVVPSMGIGPCWGEGEERQGNVSTVKVGTKWRKTCFIVHENIRTCCFLVLFWLLHFLGQY